MGKRNAGVRRHGNGRAYPGYDFEVNTGVSERLGFFAAAPEHERITAFEPDDFMTRARVCDENAVDLFLGDAMAAAPFTNENLDRLRSRLFQEGWIDQLVVSGSRRRRSIPGREPSASGSPVPRR